MSAKAQASVVFRPAQRDELQEIVRLLAEDSLGRQREATEGELPASYVEAFDAIEADNGSEVLVAAAEERVVGVMQLTVIPNLTYRGSRRALVEGVRVSPELRGQGVGERFMRWAIERARERGCRMVQLTTNRAREDAQRFYERLGFEPSHVGMKLHLDDA